jgi:hypothetical protein
MKTAWGMLLTALVVSAPGAASAVLLNGSFETPVITDPTGINAVPVGGSIGGWLVVGTPGDSVHHISNAYVESGNLRFTAQDGDQHVDLTGPGNLGANGAEGVEQEVATDVGTAYTLTFWVGNQDDSRIGYMLESSIALFIDGMAAGTFSHGGDTANDVTWMQFSHTFVATDTFTTITFLNNTPVDDNYAGLDNVALVQGVGVPEPTTLLLLGAPLLAMAALRRRHGSA